MASLAGRSLWSLRHRATLLLSHAEYVPRALHTIGLIADAENSYTSVIEYLKPVMVKARATSANTLRDAAEHAAAFLDSAWASGEARLLAAYKSHTRRSNSLVGETFRGRTDFDDFKRDMRDVSKFLRRFRHTSDGLGGQAVGGGAGGFSDGDNGGDGRGGGVRGGRVGGGGVGGGGGGGGRGTGAAARPAPGSRTSEVVHYKGAFEQCFSFSSKEGASVYSRAKIAAALKAKDATTGGTGACCLYGVALNKDMEKTWCKHEGAGEGWRHKLKLTLAEQKDAAVVVGHVSSDGGVKAVGDGRPAKRGFRGQAAGLAKRQA